MLNSIIATNISDVIINASYFHEYAFSDPEYEYLGIGITNAYSVRVQDSLFNTSYETLQFAFSLHKTCINAMELFTLDSYFSDGITTLQTSSYNFLHKAESMGIIETSFKVKMEHEESIYASSMYYNKSLHKVLGTSLPYQTIPY